MASLSAVLLLMILPVVIGYWIYAICTYDWSKHKEDIDRMGDDMFWKNCCMKHKHHIIPKHMGGTDDPSNLIELSVEEHAEAHKVLFEKYGLKEESQLL